MTTAPTPHLRALAEDAEGNGEHIYTHPRDSNKWRENEAWHRAASPGAVLHLLDRIAELEARLVAEDRATAEHKLRADQLAQQHRMQAQMHAQATQQLAELEARKPLPLSDEQIEGLREQTFSTNNPFCPCDSKTMRKAVRAAERAHGIKEP